MSSGGTQIGVWQVNSSPSPSLTQIHSSMDIGGSGDGGFFTSISSSGDANVIIWAVSRQSSDRYCGTMVLHDHPCGPPPTLFAFQPVPGTLELKPLFQSPAGNWDLPPGRDVKSSAANSNIVPVVANGHVYVASYRELDIFGFVRPVVIAEIPSTSNIQSSPGIITTVNGSQFTMKTESGGEVQVEAEAAIKNGLSTELAIGQAVWVYGSTDAQGLLHADVTSSPSTSPKSHS